MSLLLSATPPTSTSHLTATHRSSLHPFSRLFSTGANWQQAPFIGYRVQAPIVLRVKGALIAKAAAEIDGTGSSDPEPPSESKDKNVAVGDLPLESKMQLKLEQTTRMKLAKKIRLRRKKLVMKRHLRKKGRWPPSKMKKHKNV
ncbi:hypothetical protein LIER_26031 [Lithospermum erythrorhizon]|uniref:50S ribosomal protein 5, chloroplastic n=1 Tax=Lithospermum erythrorhizon TaxID=34254 RepID=A0AAV3R8G8_LITER